MPPVRRRRLASVAVVLGIVGSLLIPGMAQADEAYVPDQGFPTCGGSWGGGQSDENGTTYIACGAKVLRFAANGTRLADIALPSGTHDVAPSPDGAILYYTDGGRLRRVVRQPLGNYAADLKWKPGTFLAEGRTWEPAGYMLATDGWGDIYFSNGGWMNGSPNMIVKFSPNGQVLTQFGTWGNGIGEFNVNFGIAVTRDGRSIYVTEQTNGRIQRFDYAGGNYRYKLTFGSTNTNCDVAGQFAAPYDLGLDPWGYVYVTDTTCRRVQKLTAVGVPVSIPAKIAANGARAHGIAVDHKGGFALGQWGARYKRAATNPTPGPVPGIAPLPAPDTQAPVIRTIGVADPTCTRDVDVALDATDNVSITEIRIANENGEWSAWLPYSNPQPYRLSVGYVYKVFTVQVRDAAGNESNMVQKITEYRNCGGGPAPVVDAQAPVLTGVTTPGVTNTQTVRVEVQATDNVGVVAMRIANEDGNWGGWQAYAPAVDHTLTAGYSIKGITVQVRDAAGNESATMFHRLEYRAAAPQPAGDVAAPVLTGATIPVATVDRTVVVKIDATDDIAVTRVRFANEDGVFTAWGAFAPELQWTLSNGYGAKTMYVQVGDAAGRESRVLELRTMYEQNAPLPQEPAPNPGPGPAPAPAGPDAKAPVLVNSAVPAISATQDITVALEATDNVGVAQVRFANEDGEWAAWQPYAPQKQWKLTAGYLYKLVFAQVRDAAGNESNIVMRRSQLVEQAPPANAPADVADPVLRAVAVPDPARTQTITVGVDATDDVGVTQVRFANEDGNWTAWQPFAPQKQWTLSPGNNLYKLVFAQVKDAAGRESNIVMVRTILQM